MAEVGSLKEKRYEYQVKEQALRDQHNEALKKINDDYNKGVAILKEEGAQKLDWARIQNQGRLVEENKEAQVKLTEAQKQAEEIKQNLEKQTAELKLNKEKERLTIKDNFEQKLQTDLASFDKKIMQNQASFDSKSNEVIYDTKMALDKLRQEQATDIRHRNIDNAQRLERLSDGYNDKYLSQEAKFKDALFRQEKDQIKEIDKLTHEYSVQKNSLVTLNEDEINKKREYYRLTLEDMRKQFEKQYADQLKVNQELFQALTKKQAEMVDQMKASASKEHKALTDRLSDPFYRITQLDPAISDHEGHYEVRIKVPEHEKGLVQVSGNDRKIKITFSRSFDDKMQDLQGTTSETHRYETLGQVIDVPEIVNPSKMSKEYRDGQMIYKIAKK